MILPATRSVFSSRSPDFFFPPLMRTQRPRQKKGKKQDSSPSGTRGSSADRCAQADLVLGPTPALDVRESLRRGLDHDTQIWSGAWAGGVDSGLWPRTRWEGLDCILISGKREAGQAAPSLARGGSLETPRRPAVVPPRHLPESELDGCRGRPPCLNGDELPHPRRPPTPHPILPGSSFSS